MPATASCCSAHHFVDHRVRRDGVTKLGDAWCRGRGCESRRQQPNSRPAAEPPDRGASVAIGHFHPEWLCCRVDAWRQPDATRAVPHAVGSGKVFRLSRQEEQLFLKSQLHRNQSFAHESPASVLILGQGRPSERALVLIHRLVLFSVCCLRSGRLRCRTSQLEPAWLGGVMV